MNTTYTVKHIQKGPTLFILRFSAAYVVIPMLFLLFAAVLAVFRKWRLALYGLAVFVLFWFMMASGYLCYWK